MDGTIYRGRPRTLWIVSAGLLVLYGFLAWAVHTHWGPLHRLDMWVANRLHPTSLAHPGLVQFFKAVSTVFSPTTFRIIGLLVAILLWRRSLRPLAVWLFLTIGLTGLLDSVAKELEQRPRVIFIQPVQVLSSYSFPSGHALGSFVGAGALLMLAFPIPSLRLRVALLSLGFLAVALIAWARTGLGVHYLTDVVGGWLLGGSWLAATTAAYTTWWPARGASQPPG